jgi:alanine racemase
LNNWIEISESRLAHNFAAISQVAGAGTSVLAVVKANAYGHGVRTCAPMLARAGAAWLGVTSVTEGAEVRAVLGALQPKILVMSGILPAAVPRLVEHSLTPVVWNPEQLGWLAAPRVNVPIHIEIDTGMSRQGVKPGRDLEALLAGLKLHPNLVLDGVFTHFASSEVADSPFTRHQQSLFVQAVETVASSGLRPAWLHAANTSAVDNPCDSAHPNWLFTLATAIGGRVLVRTGLALYGHTLPIEGVADSQLRGRLQPVLTWKSHILGVRDLAPGDSLGYNATFTVRRPMRVALLSAGYADGLRRELSSTDERPGGWVMIHGRRAPILGRISMNLTSVDVSEIPGVRPGDEAILLGEGISAEDHARLARTISYEILCGIHPCA